MLVGRGLPYLALVRLSPEQAVWASIKGHRYDLTLHNPGPHYLILHNLAPHYLTLHNPALQNSGACKESGP
jgi:hypothetical protein